MLRNSFQGSSLWFISKDYVIVPHLFKLQNFYKFASIPPFPMAFDKTAINPPACFPNKRIFYTVLSVSFDTLCYHKFFTCSRVFFTYFWIAMISWVFLLLTLSIFTICSLLFRPDTLLVFILISSSVKTVKSLLIKTIMR